MEKRTKGKFKFFCAITDYPHPTPSSSPLFVIGVYVPIGGKKLLTLMDDLNMPAKDTFGSQPPLELIRQWIDYGFWYDRQKQIVKNVKVMKLAILDTTFTQ